MEAREAGSNVDYEDCGTHTNETDCTNANCFWNDQGVPPPGRCVTAICNADMDFNGRVSGSDLTVLKRNLGRVVDCPITPTNPGLLGALVEKTGQTTSYATGDDGDLEKGVAWAIPRFTDNGDGTVTDNLTGLIWLKDANCFGQVTWDNALSDSNGLASGSCGLSDGSNSGDWRLPNYKELFSLVDASNYAPALPTGHPFVNVQSSNYLSSTTTVDDTSRAWSVYMLTGYVHHYRQKDHYTYFWPVRGGQ